MKAASLENIQVRQGQQGAAGSTTEPPKRKPFVAYVWQGKLGRHDNLIPFYWLVRGRLDPERAKAATDAMPEGHSVLFSWDLLKGIGGNRQDYCRDANGELTSTPGIWWDHGVVAAARRFDAFFREYRAIGGEVDALVLDYEGSLSNWSLGKSPQRYRAILADPRFDAIAEQLGFRDIDVKVRQYRRGEYYKAWNILMTRRQAAYLNRAVMDPVSRHFPDIRLSNYGYYYSCPPHSCPDPFGHDSGRQSVEACATRSLHVGTHQSRALYAAIGSLRLARVHNGAIRLRGEGRPYGVGAFQALRLDVNQMRSMVLSADVPVQPWISHKGYRASQVKDSDLYQELLFHVGLCGPDQFLYWNPWKKGEDPEGKKDELVSDCLERLSELVGTADRRTLVRELAAWDAPYLLTGMLAAGRAVWRFTPDLDAGGRREDSLVREQPATFRVGDVEVTIPEGRNHRPEIELSKQGYWIVARAEMPPPVRE